MTLAKTQTEASTNSEASQDTSSSPLERGLIEYGTIREQAIEIFLEQESKENSERDQKKR
jgi:hypothetical protein